MNNDTNIPQVLMDQYHYPLPEDRIAKYPLAERDASQLLVYRTGEHSPISDYHFYNLPSLLPDDALLVFNNTKVVPARLFFMKETGAHIEVFCLEPASPKEYVLSFASEGSCIWYCAVGNAKKWKGGALPLYNPHGDKQLEKLGLTAELEQRIEDRYLIRFTWHSGVPFSSVLEMCGSIPIPPYLKRDAEASDVERYQTIYARFRGSVAAPTAGLHFSPAVLGRLQQKGVQIKELTLHVGAGTFKPVKTPVIKDHIMHKEPFLVTRAFLEGLIAHKGPRIAVGTTSCRCLESLFYLGLQAKRGEAPCFVPQWEPYTISQQEQEKVTYKEALQYLLDYMDSELQPGQKPSLDDSFSASTQILIVPTYRFHSLDALITNYHQSGSTLLLLIAALVGDRWKEIYQHALDSDYRFLSYGDSSLLINESSLHLFKN